MVLFMSYIDAIDVIDVLTYGAGVSCWADVGMHTGAAWRFRSSRHATRGEGLEHGAA
jgi:hypothetical protein